MKTNYRNMIIAVLALTLAVSTPALADGGNNGKPATEFKFIGNMDNQPVFELSLINSDDEYVVVFRDEAGNILFNDVYKGAAGLSKKFQLKTEDFGDAALNVTVRSRKTNTSEVYIINRNHSFVDETVIKKVK